MGCVAAKLEKIWGGRLDHVLVENGMTPQEMERLLRLTISNPQNRTMSGRMSQILLALVLFRLGRTPEASVSLARVVENDFRIDSNGAWVGLAAEGYHMHDQPFSDALVGLLKERRTLNVVDFGCGLGLYVRDLRNAGFRAGGFDGNPSTYEITGGKCLQLDLSREVDLGVRWDWVLSLEVAEHIPPEFESTFIHNLVRHACFGIVLSWGNQGGEGHVNIKEREEVERLFTLQGFRIAVGEGEVLRSAARLDWLRSTVVVLERIQVPTDCMRLSRDY